MPGMVYDSMNGVQGPYARKVGRVFLRLSRFKASAAQEGLPCTGLCGRIGCCRAGTTELDLRLTCTRGGHSSLAGDRSQQLVQTVLPFRHQGRAS